MAELPAFQSVSMHSIFYTLEPTDQVLAHSEMVNQLQLMQENNMIYVRIVHHSCSTAESWRQGEEGADISHHCDCRLWCSQKAPTLNSCWVGLSFAEKPGAEILTYQKGTVQRNLSVPFFSGYLSANIVNVFDLSMESRCPGPGGS